MTRPRCGKLLLFLVWLAGMALSSPAKAQQVPLRTFGSEPQCSTCSVQLQRHNALVVPGDSVSLSPLENLIRLRDGGFVTWSRAGNRGPLMFDSAGRFQRYVAPPGLGPGEIRRATAVLRNPGDSIWIIDGGRKHIFTPDMRYVRQDNAGSGGYSFVVGPRGAIVSEGIVNTAGSAGYPLHLRNASFQIVRSFGTDAPVIDQRRLSAMNDDLQSALERSFTRADTSTFWVYNDYRFLLEKYDFEGRLLARFRHALDGWYGRATVRNPSPGEFRGLTLNDVQTSTDRSIIWLIYHEPRPEWTPLAGGMRIDFFERMSKLDLVVEAFDPQRNQVIATGRWPRTMAVKVDSANDMIALMQPIDDVSVTFRIATLQLSRSPR